MLLGNQHDNGQYTLKLLVRVDEPEQHQQMIFSSTATPHTPQYGG
jgi:hypothetical protein